MIRRFTLTLTFSIATLLGGMVVANQPSANSSRFRTAEFSSGDSNTLLVSNRRRDRRNRPRYNRGDYYRPYRYRYSYRPYSYRYYPRYYGTPRFGYYDYGRRGGGVRIGPFGVWW